ncbi:hypothetical protein [Paenibacillus silviterrae]|uniref:hypothetical protein n=1 Tax=Paenibacillus silviterrae TaxID=3242194 RepID=UPI0025431F36|nr:hypothetical protein [Paenibacillus chinjuensis]
MSDIEIAKIMSEIDGLLSSENEEECTGASYLTDWYAKYLSMKSDLELTLGGVLLAAIQDAKNEALKDKSLEGLKGLLLLMQSMKGKVKKMGTTPKSSPAEEELFDTVSMTEVTDVDIRLAGSKPVTKPASKVNINKTLRQGLIRVLDSFADFADVEWGTEDSDYSKNIQKLSRFVEEMKRVLGTHAKTEDWDALNSTGFLYLLNNVGDDKVFHHCHRQKMKQLRLLLG